MKQRTFWLIALLGIALTFVSCETSDDFDPYYPDDCEDCGDNSKDGNDDGNDDDDNNDDNNQDPVAGADLTIYLDVASFEGVYGQLETNGDEYLNFYGSNRSVHLNLATLEVEATGTNIISIATADAEADKKGYNDISENLYYDHVQKIWLWVYNKDSESFMIEMGKTSWTMSPSAKSRFFDYDFEIKEENKQAWLTIGEKKVAFVAGLDS